MANLVNYIKKIWKDAPSTDTPINAENLNHMEDGIYNNATAINQLNSDKADISDISTIYKNQLQKYEVRNQAITEGAGFILPSKIFAGRVIVDALCYQNVVLVPYDYKSMHAIYVLKDFQGVSSIDADIYYT